MTQQELPNRNPTISIIMTAFNAAATIERAITSARSQTFGDFELLVINDGSTDHTRDIAERIAACDPRIRLLNQENCGVGKARARGIAEACGKYSIHLDADDIIEPTMLSDMFETAERDNADIVICDFSIDTPGREPLIIKQSIPEANQKELISNLLTGKLHGSLCNKLIKNSLYHEWGITTTSSLSFGEDMIIVLQLLLHNPKVRFAGKAYYHYFYTPNSATSSFSATSCNARKQWATEIKRYLPARYSGEYDILKFRTKIHAFYAGAISRKEFYEFSPTRIKYLKALQGARRFRPGAWLAVIGMFHLGRLYCKALGTKHS